MTANKAQVRQVSRQLLKLIRCDLTAPHMELSSTRESCRGAYIFGKVGPLEALEAAGAEALARGIIDLIGGFNTSGDETVIVPSEYLEVVLTKQ
jgi:hypothetical protein